MHDVAMITIYGRFIFMGVVFLIALIAIICGLWAFTHIRREMPDGAHFKMFKVFEMRAGSAGGLFVLSAVAFGVIGFLIDPSVHEQGPNNIQVATAFSAKRQVPLPIAGSSPVAASIVEARLKSLAARETARAATAPSASTVPESVTTSMAVSAATEGYIPPRRVPPTYLAGQKKPTSAVTESNRKELLAGFAEALGSNGTSSTLNAKFYGKRATLDIYDAQIARSAPNEFVLSVPIKTSTNKYQVLFHAIRTPDRLIFVPTTVAAPEATSMPASATAPAAASR